MMIFGIVVHKIKNGEHSVSAYTLFGVSFLSDWLLLLSVSPSLPFSLSAFAVVQADGFSLHINGL